MFRNLINRTLILLKYAQICKLCIIKMKMQKTDAKIKLLTKDSPTPSDGSSPYQCHLTNAFHKRSAYFGIEYLDYR